MTTHATMAIVRLATEADPANRTLFVHSLDWSAGADDLLSTFSRFGFENISQNESLAWTARANSCGGSDLGLGLDPRQYNADNHNTRALTPMNTRTQTLPL
uniref:Uncharacterized protein n=1 Tax=Oryza nivara TaxID=4536 RepID=A0A0E0G6P1_ORYNI